MTLSRRRFLTISAGFAAAPFGAQAAHWRGRAFGADVSLEIRAPRDVAGPALDEARGLIARMEGLFSLYDPASSLSRLNAAGALTAPPADFVALMDAAEEAHRLTGGLFDPTVQPLWRAAAEGGDLDMARAAVGWDRVAFDSRRVRLGAGQALTFNGIAQGYATDLVTEALVRRGLRDVLVNISEHRGVGGPWRLGLSDPAHGHLGTRTLTTGAIATSSPGAMQLGANAHILHPAAHTRWSTVTVEATTATMADSLSTALVLATRTEAEAIRRTPGVRRVTLVDATGDLTTI